MNIPDLSKIFHLSSKDRSRNHPPVSRDFAEWPDEWKTIYYKSYPRLPKLRLTVDHPSNELFTLAQKRRSRWDFADLALTQKELSALLRYSCGNTDLPTRDYRRVYPSAGARFPIEIYPIILKSGEDLRAGLYHYGISDHSLDTLWDLKLSDEHIGELFEYPWVKNASLVIIMTAVFWRTQNKYGERGYRYVLLEAGHIGQNLYLVAEALGLKCCALGGTIDGEVEKLLDIDGVTESVVYAIAVGK